MTGAPWTAPPVHYEAWITCLAALEEGPVSHEALALLVRGTLDLEPSEITTYFQPRLTRAVNAMLQRAVRRLNRQIRQSLEWGEPDDLLTALRRFRRATQDCLFFRQLSFLPAPCRQALADAVEAEVGKCWADMERWLTRACAAGDPRLEGLRRPLRRLRPCRKTG